MKKRRITSLLMAIVILVPSLFASGGVPSVSEIGLRSMVVANPDSVLMILDDLEKHPTPEWPSYKISLMRMLAYNEKRMYAFIEKYARETLENDSIDRHPKIKLNALAAIVDAHMFFGNIQGAIDAATKAINLARETGNLPVEINVLTNMAQANFSLGNNTTGYELLEQAIEKGISSDDVRVLANVSTAYGVKIIQLNAEDRYEEGLKEGYKRLELVERMEQIGGAPEGYTDQQLAYTYARIASSAQNVGTSAEAAEAYRKFHATAYGSSDVGQCYIIDYLLAAGKYRTVLQYTRPLYAMLAQGDTINIEYHGLILSDASAYAGLGNYKEGYDLLQRANVIQDSIYMREKNSRAQELATIFDLNEKQLELEKSKAQSQKRLILLWAATGMFILVMIILICLWYQYKIIRKHNRLAVQRIDELLMQHEQAEKLSVEEDNPDMKLFLEMEHKITDEELYKDPSFNREGIIEATGLSRSKVVQLIQEFAGLTPVDFINKLRVEKSVRLIKEHPDWTIEGIAESCGYTRRATYYSNFNKFYGITPAQYRKEQQKNPPQPEGPVSDE